MSRTVINAVLPNCVIVFDENVYRRRADLKEQREQKILSSISARSQTSATESRLALIKNLTSQGNGLNSKNDMLPNSHTPVLLKVAKKLR